jgi:hypothetical protein
MILRPRQLPEKHSPQEMTGWRTQFILSGIHYFSCNLRAVSFADAGHIRVLKYWVLAFCGVGQHNYPRECAEVLVRWRYEPTNKLRSALERSWFVNRIGKPGRFIPSDLYLEQLNFWVKVSRVML